MEYKNFAKKNDLSIVFTHHTKKGGDFNSDAVLGSTALVGAVDTLIQMDRLKKSTKFQTLQRYGTPFEGVHLIFDPKIKSYSFSKIQDEGDLKSEILVLLRSRRAGFKKEELYIELPFSPKKIDAALLALINEHLIISMGKGLKGSPKKFFTSDYLDTGVFMRSPGEPPRIQ